MSIQVQGGTWDGSAIRKARKSYKCQYWRGMSNGGRCKAAIHPGDYYCEGEPNFIETGRNGVILMDRWCLQCAGPEALATVGIIGC